MSVPSLLLFSLLKLAHAAPNECMPTAPTAQKMEAWIKESLAQIDSNSATVEQIKFLRKALPRLAELRGESEEATKARLLKGRSLEQLEIKVREDRIRNLAGVAQTDASFGSISAIRQEIRTLQGEAGSALSPASRAAAGQVAAMPDADHSVVSAEKRACGEARDQSSKLGPVRNQGNLGWCGHYALAEAISFKTGKRVSPANLALNHIQQGSPTSFYELASATVGRGFRPQDFYLATYGAAVGYAAMNYGNGNEIVDKDSKKIPEGLAGLESAFRSAQKYSHLCTEEYFRSDDASQGEVDCNLRKLHELHQKLAAESNQDQRCEFEARVRTLFPKASRAELLRVLSAKTLTDGLRQLQSDSCRGENSVTQTELRKLKINSTPALFGTRDLIERTLDRQLNRNNIALISVKSDFLDKDQFSSGGGGHFLTVVGRRWNESKKTCEYLLRNSWGQNYDGSGAGWEKDATRPGHAWVSKAALARNISGVTYLE